MNSKTRVVRIGNLSMGGDNPILVQTMWDRPLSSVISEDLQDIERLKDAGCDLLRFAVPDLEAAKALGIIAERSVLPLVADIHFDYKLALAVMDYPIAKIRINPGNIGASWKVEEVLKKASDKNVALRIGANQGSLPSSLKNYDNPAEAMVKAAESQLDILEKNHFYQAVVSLKSSSIKNTVEANRIFASRYDFPLHLGVTEAGPIIPSLVKSTLALGELLKEGIGDTLRISISDSPFREIQAARELLSQLGLDSRAHIELISCPKCGRTGFDTHKFTADLEEDILRLNKNLTLAIMGCEVNGPGEAKHADLGIAGSGDKVVIFRKGSIIRREPLCNAHQAFLEELAKL